MENITLTTDHDNVARVIVLWAFGTAWGRKKQQPFNFKQSFVFFIRYTVVVLCTTSTLCVYSHNESKIDK